MMLVAERHSLIKQIIKEMNSVKVIDLAQRFNVTEETIRRDFLKLENEGWLKRSHGGAVYVDNQADQPLVQREVLQVKEKQKIAKRAVENVNEGDIIMLDASSTAWFMAKALPNIKLTVVTNALNIIEELSRKHNINVISTGGTLDHDSMSFVGPQTVLSLKAYHVTKLFISCKGLAIDEGFTESNEQQNAVKQQMLLSSSEHYFLLDYTKISRKSFTKLADIESADYLITDRVVSPSTKEVLNKQQVIIDDFY